MSARRTSRAAAGAGSGGAMRESELRSAFNSIDTSGNGFIDKSELGALLQRVNPGKPVHQNDVLFAMTEIDSSADGRIDYKEFRKWYTRTNVGHKGSSYNKLLVRDVVGRSKRSSYDLPSKDFTFGYTVPQDSHDAKATMTNWYTGKPRLGGSDILKARAESGRPRGYKEATYGTVNRPSTPMGRLLRGEFGVIDKDEEYPESPGAATKRRAPTAVRATRATLAQMEHTKELAREAEAAAGTWKLKKFANVKSRVFE